MCYEVAASQSTYAVALQQKPSQGWGLMAKACYRIQQYSSELCLAPGLSWTAASRGTLSPLRVRQSWLSHTLRCTLLLGSRGQPLKGIGCLGQPLPARYAAIAESRSSWC